jgi:mannosyltransferase OCH1-like enzyme
MIPKRAFFFWAGEPMSWLRREGVASFRRHNPDWEVVMLDDCAFPLQKDSLLRFVQCSDWARYAALYERGGVYFDTDMIFLRPIPEAWLVGELLFPTLQDGHFTQIAVLGAAQGGRFFRTAIAACAQRVREPRALGYQDLGVALLDTLVDSIGNTAVVSVPLRSVVPIDWTAVYKLWSPAGSPLPASVIALHWFGGDHLSRHMEASLDDAWFEGKSLLAGCIRASRGAA